MHPYAIFTLTAGACYLVGAAWISRRFGKHHLGWRRVFGLVGFVIGATFVVTYRLPPGARRAAPDGDRLPGLGRPSWAAFQASQLSPVAEELARG